MDRIQKTSYVGAEPRGGPDVRSVPVSGTSSPCGEIRHFSSQAYPQPKQDFRPICILEVLRTIAHIWGYGFPEVFHPVRTCPQPEAFIHR